MERGIGEGKGGYNIVICVCVYIYIKTKPVSTIRYDGRCTAQALCDEKEMIIMKRKIMTMTMKREKNMRSSCTSGAMYLRCAEDV